jgi:hypothetical protein
LLCHNTEDVYLSVVTIISGVLQLYPDIVVITSAVLLLKALHELACFAYYTPRRSSCLLDLPACPYLHCTTATAATTLNRDPNDVALARHLGVETLTRAALYRRSTLPRFTQFPAVLQHATALNLLLELPLLLQQDPELKAQLAALALIPKATAATAAAGVSGVSAVAVRAAELYDPAVPELQALLPEER